MAPPQTNSAAIPQELVTKVGSAAGRIAGIQREYAKQAETETAPGAREAVANRIQEAAEQVLDEQGITVQDYNSVLSAAEGDPDLERRLLDAARKAL